MASALSFFREIVEAIDFDGDNASSLVAPTGAAVATYDFGEGFTIDEGKYELSGEARLNYYVSFGQSNSGEDNKAELTASISAGETVSKNIDISHEWTAFNKIYLTIDENTDLTAVTLAFTDATKAASSVNKTIDIRNVKLVKLETPGTYSSMFNGAPAVASKSYEVVDVEDGNTFIHVNDRVYAYINPNSNVPQCNSGSGFGYQYSGTYIWKHVLYGILRTHICRDRFHRGRLLRRYCSASPQLELQPSPSGYTHRRRKRIFLQICNDPHKQA